MKKYVKPELFYEKFELSQHIASCDLVQFNHRDWVSCQIRDDNDLGLSPGDNVFGDESCDVIIEDYCYTNGTGGSMVFGS